GNHYISLEKQGHVFSEGRFPATGNFNFQDNIFSHIQFVDSTLLKVVGRVVGGSQQGGKTAGLGRSVNNIGQAHLNFSSMNGCVDYPVDTDPATGEYVAYLPPLRYAVDTVVIPSNLAIGFGTIKLVDLRVVPPVTEVVDTLFFPGTSVVQSIDSTSFYMQHDYVYRVAPQLDVYADEGNTPFMGDAELDYLDPNGDEQIIDLNTTAFDFPVLHQRRKYKAYIRASELYQNFDIDPTNPAEDKVSVIDGEMIINNQLAAQVSENIGFTEQDSGLVVYEFLGGFPNTNLNNTTPEYSFTKPINITLLTTGNSVEWQPYAANSAPGGGGDKYFRAYLFGSEPTGTAFVTKGPSKVELVLRDPPGSSSQSTWSAGTTITKSESYRLNDNRSVSLSNKISVGANTWLITGPTITEADSENNLELGLDVGLSFEDEKEITTTISSSTSISTPNI
ncbi:MAG: hypothetical protein ACPG5P_06500, partial [Saprospiraceae bacterium]